MLLLTVMTMSVLLASGVANAIINGQADGNAHPYVGALVGDFDGQKVAICSGTLISPTVFITAGHCTDFLQDEDVPTYVSFDPTFDQSSALVSGTAYTHPLYRDTAGNGLPEFDAYDVGVVVLDQPVTDVGYAQLPRQGLVDTLNQGQLLTTVGYGGTGFDRGGGPPDPIYPDVRNRATVKLLNTTSRTGDMFIKVRGGSAGKGNEGTCFGDSGGPFFLPDQRTIVAVTSFGTNGVCAGNEYEQRLDLPEVLSWVRSFL
jgi:hypothetical protein